MKKIKYEGPGKYPIKGPDGKPLNLKDEIIVEISGHPLFQKISFQSYVSDNGFFLELKVWVHGCAKKLEKMEQASFDFVEVGNKIFDIDDKSLKCGEGFSSFGVDLQEFQDYLKEKIKSNQKDSERYHKKQMEFEDTQTSLNELLKKNAKKTQ